MDPLKILGENIRRQIVLKGYATVEVFAHEHALNKGTLSKILNGKVDAKVSTLLRIALALDVSLTDILPKESLPESWVMENSKAGSYQAAPKRKKRRP